MTDKDREALAVLQTAHESEVMMQAKIDRLVTALDAAEKAIAEYYRYWTGGETRGSYDGKPERAGLWKAQSQARATLAALKDRTHD